MLHYSNFHGTRTSKDPPAPVAQAEIRQGAPRQMRRHRRAGSRTRRRLGDHSERRRRIRFRATLPIRIHTTEGEVHGETRNVSLLGASAITDRPATQGATATAELDLPGGGLPIRMEGTIVRSIPLDVPGDSRYEVGVFAMKYPDQDETRLSQYLEQLQIAEYAAVRAGYKALREKIRRREAHKRALLLAQRRRRARRLARRRRRARAAAKRAAARRRTRR